jgi:DNA-binding CsgD family transcriptional regulator
MAKNGLGELMTLSPSVVGAGDHASHGLVEHLQAWADLEGRPRAIIGDGRQLIWGNNACMAALGSGRDVFISSNSLQVADPAQTEMFDQVLRRTGPNVSAWSYRRPDGDGCVLFRFWRISKPGQALANGLVFHGTGSDFIPRWADFAAPFDLTPTEARTVQQLVDGDPIAEIAARLGLSVLTLRTHVRNAYAKIGVNSREGLFRALAAYRVV